MTIKVVATAPGYYGCYRDIGDKFGITDKKQFSHNWMADIEGKVKDVADPVPVAEVPVGEAGDGLDGMDDDALIAYGKANCVGLRLTRAMKDETIRKRIRDYMSGASA